MDPSFPERNTPSLTDQMSKFVSVEGLELVCLHRCLVLVQVRQGILRSVMVSIIVSVNSLGFKASYRIELLDGSGAEACEGTEDSALDLSHLGILHSIDQCVLRLCRMVLELLGGILFAERGNLIEVHLQVMRHLLCQIVLWCHCPAFKACAHLCQVPV